jgi:anti-sigma factor RsiW
MDITRNVILDLLPLYVADEVSADTRALVEKYLETDPELANVAKQLEVMEKPRDIPVPLSQDDKMRTYRQARRQRLLITIIIAGAISIFLVLTLFVFFSSPQ